MIPNFVYAEDLSLSAESAIAVDAYTGNILYERNINEKHAMASTTKIMTCLIACESGKLDETIEITEEMLYGTEGSMIYINPGDKITLYDLVCGAMIASGNDAANAIAVYLGGSVKKFSDIMNNRAEELGMYSTKFVTPSGLDKSNHHSTAYDMALLARAAVLNEELIKIAGMKSAEIFINGKEQTIYNHNKLLSYNEHYIGLKTGYTKKAGRCLVTAYKYENNIIVCVTLSAPDDWEDHKRLVKYAKKCYKKISKEENIKINVVGGTTETVQCKSDYSLSVVSEVTVKRYFYPFAYAPVNEGDILGREEIYINNQLVKTVDIKAAEGINQWQETTT